MCVCNIDAKVCCTLFAALAEQSSRKRARTEPKTPASLTTHKTSNNGKKKPRRRRSKKKKKQLERSAAAKLHIAFSRLSRCQRENYCGKPPISLTLKQNSLSGYKPLDDNSSISNNTQDQQ